MTDRTPRYHDISIFNLTATDDRPGQKDAGQLIGLPESPLVDIWLTNVSIDGTRKGIEMRNASVHTCNVQVTPRQGPPFVIEENTILSECAALDR